MKCVFLPLVAWRDCYCEYNRNSVYIKEIKTMTKWECTVCGYIYDPEKGDGISGIDPGTPFEDLPEDWVCPACGANKEAFEKVE